MNSQERDLLQDFLDRLAQTRGVQKVPEADEMIRKAVAQQPDAAYLLVQRALLLTQALEQAKARIAELESAQTQSSASFLEPGTSNWSPPYRGSAAGPASGSAPRAPSQPYTASPSAGTYAPAPPPAAAPAAPWGGSSFLGSAAATAAGVAGGAFLFEGIENLLGHHQGMAAYGPTAGAFPAEDVTVNNNYYYPDDSRATDAEDEDRPDLQDTDVDDSDSSGDDDFV